MYVLCNLKCECEKVGDLIARTMRISFFKKVKFSFLLLDENKLLILRIPFPFLDFSHVLEIILDCECIFGIFFCFSFSFSLQNDVNFNDDVARCYE